MHKLEVRGLKKTIKGTPIIKGISLELYNGEIVGLLGPNGAGKTTTFYMICGLISASGGDILLNENSIAKVPLHKRAKLGIGILITDHNVRETLAICDRAYVIKDGELLASGSAKEVANDKNVKKYYLGEDFSI